MQPPLELHADDELGKIQQAATAGLRVNRSRRKVADAFNAASPVSDRYVLNGRFKELQRMVSSVVDGRRHAIVYGARGVGKTSLARVFGDLVDEAGCDVFYHSANGDISFANVMMPYVKMLMGSAPAGPGDQAVFSEETLNAHTLSETLVHYCRRRVILILDEFDRIESKETRSEMASLLKILSDYQAEVQFVLVGISTDLVSLIDEHPSLRRHLSAIRVGPIADTEAEKLLAEAQRRSEMKLAPKVIQAILQVALGSPFHIRLLAQHAALGAFDKGDQTVDEVQFLESIEDAWEEWASLSLPTARALLRLAALKDQRQGLITVASVAARDYGFDEERIADVLAQGAAAEPAHSAQALELMELVEPVTTTSVSGERVFRDSLAPQFLLLTMLLQDKREQGFSLANWLKTMRSSTSAETKPESVIQC